MKHLKSMASSSTSSTKRSRIYDVFLSFRGEDTRNTFTDHLYTALVNAGVRTFRDDPGLERGDNISEALIKAIKGSTVSVVVISPGYADSPWCLDELVHIMGCSRGMEQKVLPVFYHVEPSDVRHQKGSFGKALEEHEARKRRTQDEVSGWRSALRDVAYLSGWVLSGSEAMCIKEIVDSITRKLLDNGYLNVAVYPVGIESRIKDICDSLSDGGKDDVRMVGIWGMGGSGKSSLAKAVYNKFYHTFENKSFLGNVRETAKESSTGKITLQERLLSDILKPTKKIEVGDADRGINVIKERLGSMKVLVIVDDVDDRDQLTALALLDDSIGWRKTFGPGSRIIVTTRNQHLLELLGVDKIHVTREMNQEEALELVSWHAFHNPRPDSGFSELTRRVVTYCKGLPLALEVLGSFLFGRRQRDWKDTLKNLEKFPDGKIDKILRISFDALDEDQKEIFLHICCFFVGMDKKYVTHILHGCGHSSKAGISVLLQRCLVTVSERNKLMMHDLLRDMGREEVRVESPKEPEERSRLWHQKEVMDVLTEESGTKQIEGLALNLQRSDKMRFKTKAFEKMKKLKLLQLNYVQLHGDSEYLPRMLRWLCWRGFSLRTIPKDFLNEQNLVSIDLRYSNLVQVWEQSRLLEKLKILNLSHSHYLKQTPDFSNLPNLKYLILKDCRSLSEIHESIGHLGRLALLNLKDCIKLKDLPKSFYKLKSVQTLILSGCLSFEDLSDDIGNSMSSLTTLLVSGTAISKLPSSLGGLELNYSSRQDLILVKQRYPDVPRYHFPALPRGFTSLNMGSTSVHSLPVRPCFSNCTNIPAEIIPSSSKASRQSNSILQGLTAKEDAGICLAGNDFPKRFTYVRKSDQVFFQVPQFIGCNLKALTVRVVCSLHSSDDLSPSRNSIIVTNHSKLICFVVRPAYPTEITSLHEVIWQGNLSNFQLRLEGGDFVQVEVVAGAGLRVKKTGVSLVWDPIHFTENFVECEPIPYEDFRSDADYQAGTINVSSDEDRPSKTLKLPSDSDNQAGRNHDSSDEDRPSKRSKLVQE